MNTESQITTTDPKNLTFGMRLKKAREAINLERTEAAAQLRLNEKILIMIERERYPADMPVMFVRGYIRAYAKLLNIPEAEIKKALEPIKPKATPMETNIPSRSTVMTSGNYYMQIFTYLIMFTVIGLAGIWWYSHYIMQNPNQEIAANSTTEANDKFITVQTAPTTPGLGVITANAAPSLNGPAPTLAQSSIAITAPNMNNGTGTPATSVASQDESQHNGDIPAYQIAEANKQKQLQAQKNIENNTDDTIGNEN